MAGWAGTGVPYRRRLGPVGADQSCARAESGHHGGVRTDRFERLFEEHAEPLLGFLVYRTGNRPLAEAIATYLNLPLTKANIRRFSDLEIFVEILENVRGEDVFVIQSTSYPANDSSAPSPNRMKRRSP